MEIHKQYVVDSDGNPIAVQIPIEEFRRIELMLDLPSESTVPGSDPGGQASPETAHVAGNADPDLLWVREHRHEYAGQWVVLDGGRLVSHGKNPKETIAEARRQGVIQPFFTFIEPPEEFTFGGWI